MYVKEGWVDWPATITPRIEPWQQSYLEAAHYLRTFGWIQGKYRERCSRKVCMIGALAEFDEEAIYYHNPLRFHLEQILGEAPESWNDAPKRTIEEVIEMLEKAAGY